MTPYITAHAVEQFIRRWEPNKSSEEATEELDALLRTSKIVGRTRSGQTIAVSGHRPEVRLVLKERNVCVTVLPAGSFHSVPTELERELMDELMEELNSISAARISELKVDIENLRLQVVVIGDQRIRIEDARLRLLEDSRELGRRKTELLNDIHVLEKELKELELWDLSSK